MEYEQFCESQTFAGRVGQGESLTLESFPLGAWNLLQTKQKPLNVRKSVPLSKTTVRVSSFVLCRLLSFYSILFKPCAGTAGLNKPISETARKFVKDLF